MLAASIVGLVALPAGAQPLVAHHVLGNVAQPFGGLVLASDGVAYGTSRTGGTHDCGYVYRLERGGSPAILHQFTGANGCQPHGELIEGVDGALYGTTYAGGPNVDAQAAGGTGTVYRITRSGTHSVFHAFAAISSGVHPEGWAPLAGLVRGADGSFYGTTSSGGTGASGPFLSGAGTAFRLAPAGGLTVLHHFSATLDGARPDGGLILGNDGNLYGTHLGGAANLAGALYRLTPAGQYSRIFGFPWTGCGSPSCFPLGANPRAAPVEVGSEFYVLGRDYGTGANGTVVRATPNGMPDGAGTVIHAFSGADGATPEQRMTLASDGHLYGVTRDGGVNDSGTIFRVANGQFAPLHQFVFPNGTDPEARVIEVAPSVFLGTTSGGGASGGTLYRMSLIPPTAPAAVSDAYATPFQTSLQIAAPGVLGNDAGNGGGTLIGALVAAPQHGVVQQNADGSFIYTPAAGFVGTDTFTYRAANWFGQSNVATVTVTVNPLPSLQPAGLYVSSMVGRSLTLRWTPPSAGPSPTEYVVEGGVSPGQVLASLRTGSRFPIFSFTAPAGAFYVRVHALAGGLRSGPSNEIRIFVDVPQSPSAPSGLVGTASGSTLGLAWRNTFAGGRPTSLILDVAGSFVGSLPLAVADQLTFPGVPGGTYTLSLRARNSAGTSPPSNSVTLTFPAGCSGPPLAPEHFLASHVDRTVTVVWEPAAAGAAPSSYVVGVTGAVTTSVPTAGRTLRAAAPPGTYDLRITAVNPCGSATTAVQTIVVP